MLQLLQPLFHLYEGPIPLGYARGLHLQDLDPGLDFLPSSLEVLFKAIQLLLSFRQGQIQALEGCFPLL